MPAAGAAEESSSDEEEEEWAPALSGSTGADSGEAGPSTSGAAAAATASHSVAGPLDTPAAAGTPRARDAAQRGCSEAGVKIQQVPAQLPPAQQAQQEEEENFGAVEMEWWYPEVQGEAPGGRGYHSAAVSEDGSKVYYFGGIAPGGSCASLAVLDCHTWTFSRPATSGNPPPPRCGHSSCVYGGRLWVVGGGSGHDLLRSGHDLGDVYCLDLTTLEWTRAAVPAGPLCAGKCHSSALLGSRLLLFAGSMPTCAELAFLDLETLRWGVPARILGPPPDDRMSATAVLAGEEVLVFGGYTFHAREVGDLYRLRLLPSQEDEQARGSVQVPASGRTVRRWSSFWG